MGFDIGGLVGGLVGGKLGKALGVGIDDMLGIKPEGGGGTGDILSDVLHALEGDSSTAATSKGDTAGSKSDTIAGLAHSVKAGGGSSGGSHGIFDDLIKTGEHKAEDWLKHLIDGKGGSSDSSSAPKASSSDSTDDSSSTDGTDSTDSADGTDGTDGAGGTDDTASVDDPGASDGGDTMVADAGDSGGDFGGGDGGGDSFDA